MPGSTEGEVLNTTLGNNIGIKIGLYKYYELGSIYGSFGFSNNIKLDDSSLGEVLESYDGSVIGYIVGALDYTNHGMIEVSIIGEEMVYIDILVPDSDEGITLICNDGEVIDTALGNNDGMKLGVYGWSELVSIYGLFEGYNYRTLEGSSV